MTEQTKENNIDAGVFQEEGAFVDLGFGNTVRFHPLTWGAMRRLRKEWNTVFGANSAATATPEWQDASALILYESAKRGNPALVFDDFLEMLDSRNAAKCFEALAIASGMRAKPVTTTEGPGETAVRPTLSPDGASSTQSSSQTPVGPSTSATN